MKTAIRHSDWLYRLFSHVFSFAEIIFCQGKKMFCVFSSTRMKTKKTKLLMSFKSKFCDKNRQTQKFVLNFKNLDLNLKFEFEM